MRYALVCLGDTLHKLGEHAEAERLLTEAVALARATGNRERGASAHWSLGLLLKDRGQLAEALGHFRESLVLYYEVGTPNILGTYNIIPAVLQSIAGVESVQGRPTKAARLLGAADALNATVSAGRHDEQDPEHLRATARTTDRLRDLLGEPAFAAAWAEGEAMTLSEVVEDALAE